MRDMVGGVLQVGRLAGGVNRLPAGVSRHTKHGVGIEHFGGVVDRSGALPALLRFLVSARIPFLLRGLLLLPEPGGLVLVLLLLRPRRLLVICTLTIGFVVILAASSLLSTLRRERASVL